MTAVAADWIAPDWIAVDWGTSRLRAWALSTGGEVLAERHSDAGMGRLEPAAFEPALLAVVGPWLTAGRRVPVIACGMVGARQGWVEVPYQTVPCRPVAAATVAPCRDGRLSVSILPGLSQRTPPDVMRGEETQIAGFLAREPDFDGVLCLPGTHTKWAQVSAGEVVSFRTAMTGELFAAISGHTVLRHSIGTVGWDTEAFAAAVEETLSRPERLATQIFTIRAQGLLEGLPASTARARLSGLFVGAELAAMRAYWLGQRVVLIGAADHVARYADALSAQGLAPERADGTGATLAGLALARATLGETRR
jgi:2-dehydro-3-deoxygalactonokinase